MAPGPQFAHLCISMFPFQLFTDTDGPNNGDKRSKQSCSSRMEQAESWCIHLSIHHPSIHPNLFNPQTRSAFYISGQLYPVTNLQPFSICRQSAEGVVFRLAASAPEGVCLVSDPSVRLLLLSDPVRLQREQTRMLLLLRLFLP